jgi:2,3-bisphosphoglycerate-independent phosphoglycerate mutase
MTTYEDTLPVHVIFPPQDVKEPLAKVIADAGRTQFHTAETEKYPHVTFFLNGGREEPFAGEDRQMAASPKVATYDLQPEMSAAEVKNNVIGAIRSGKYDFIIVNFANDDMVGHTGSIPAAVKAVETVDECLGRVVEAVRAREGACLITADHGNAEQMLAEDGSPHTAHTTNLVPLVLTDTNASISDGELSDLAPTVLAALGLDKPLQMTGKNLISGP